MEQVTTAVHAAHWSHVAPVIHEPLRGCAALEDSGGTGRRREHSVDPRWSAVQVEAHNEAAFVAIRVSDPEVRQAGLVVIQRTVADIVDDAGALEARGRVEPDEPRHAVGAVAG